MMEYIMGNDKAIEFQSELLKVNNMIEHLNEVGISARIQKKELELVLKTLKDDINGVYTKIDETSNLQILNKMTLENSYSIAINSLKSIEMKLSKYNDYFSAYYYCESLKKEFDKGIKKEDIDNISMTIISLLKKINYSDTMCYDNEKAIVENLYHIAYKVIKLELKLNGESKILDFAKSNPIANSFLNNEVKEEIKNCDNKIPYIDLIKSRGIDCDYLDKALLLFLSLQDDRNNIENIINELEELKKEIDLNLDKMLEYNEKYFSSKKTRKSNLKEYRKFISKNIACYALITTVITGVIGLAYHLSKKGTQTTKYMTTTEIYSENDVALNTIKTDYEIKREDSFETVMVEYMPWEKKKNGNFKRDVINYDVDFIELENIEEYVNLDIDSLGIKTNTTVETKKSLTLDDLYDEAYYEITRTIQNQDIKSVEDGDNLENVTLFLLLFSFISMPVALCSLCKIGDIIRTGKCAKEYLSSSKIDLINMREALESYKRLYDNDLEIREKFNAIFNNYKELLSEETVKKLVLKEKLNREIK